MQCLKRKHILIEQPLISNAAVGLLLELQNVWCTMSRHLLHFTSSYYITNKQTFIKSLFLVVNCNEMVFHTQNKNTENTHTQKTVLIPISVHCIGH